MLGDQVAEDDRASRRAHGTVCERDPAQKHGADGAAGARRRPLLAPPAREPCCVPTQSPRIHPGRYCARRASGIWARIPV
ncbi:hypothetical protein OPT61_g5845 [Boeremia exigua]|uniref:Uncharacterized protein n=1 Tax=Boeremia exigua TaxID=749465 RepID=A0ACC2I8U6_9PLEO|nr:hypothetical protein OPT61_g5845 [Boeremia exigua]